MKNTQLETELAAVIIRLLNVSSIPSEYKQLAYYSVAKVVGYGHPIFNKAA